jgi:hypothetical protein
VLKWHDVRAQTEGGNLGRIEHSVNEHLFYSFQ